MIFMMVEYGMNLTVQSTILFTKEGNYGCILNVDWFHPYMLIFITKILSGTRILEESLLISIRRG
jgi:hypothetical protein